MPPPEPLPVGERLIAEFAGLVEIEPATPAVNCRLAGLERGTGIALEVHFSGASGAPAAGTLTDVQVFECAGDETRAWRVCAGAHRYRLQARAVQVHRMPEAAFYAAVPGEPLTLTTRAGWALLLNVLRIPGAARLIRSLRSSRA